MKSDVSARTRSPWLALRWQALSVSFRLDRRVPVVLAVLGAIALGTGVASVAWGDYPVPPLAAFKAAFGLPTDSPDYAFIVRTLRLPRAIAAFAVGAGLGLAGTLIQSLVRNPLAAPGVIGINAGASLAAVALLVAFPALPVAMLPIAAFGGALAVALFVYWLAWQDGSSPGRLILVGISLQLIASAVTNLLVTFGDIYAVSAALVWLSGSVYGCSWPQVVALLPWLVGGGAIALALSRAANALALGDEIALGLGCAVERQRSGLLLVAAALSGACVATAGAVGFVGLMAPHLARRLVGPTCPGLLPTAALTGGVLVLAADLLGRLAFAPVELPCGLITAAIGAPFFLVLLIRQGRP